LSVRIFISTVPPSMVTTLPGSNMIEPNCAVPSLRIVKRALLERTDSPGRMSDEPAPSTVIVIEARSSPSAKIRSAPLLI
jgi:hypothetical protein